MAAKPPATVICHYRVKAGKEPDFLTLLERLNDRRFRAALVARSAGSKAELTRIFHSGEQLNFQQAENAALDSLMETADVEHDRAKAKALWSQAQRIIIDEAYYTVLYEISDLMAVDGRFQNVKPNAVRWDDNIAEWYVPDGRQRYDVPLAGAPTARAETNGWRRPMLYTCVPRRMRSVTAAIDASITNGSNVGVRGSIVACPAPSTSDEAMSTGKIRCSGIHTDS